MLHYDRMRATILASPALDARVREIVLVAQFAVLGHEDPFKIHARRALDHGATKDTLRAALMIGFGATLIACEVARSIGWLDDVCNQKGAS